MFARTSSSLSARRSMYVDSANLPLVLRLGGELVATTLDVVLLPRVGLAGNGRVREGGAVTGTLYLGQ